MSDPQTQLPAVMQQEKNVMEYIPFGADAKIKLTLKIVRDLVAIPTKSGHYPSDRDCTRFMMLCQAQRLNPFAGDCYLQGYDSQDGPQFSLITAHQALLKRAEVNDHFRGLLSGVIVKDDNDSIVEREGDFLLPGDFLLGGWAKVFRNDRDFPTYRRLSLGTFNQGFGRWKKDAAGMIVKCAEADALRSSFPTLLGGLYTAEEKGEIIDIGPSQGAAKAPDMGRKPRAVTDAKPAATQPATAVNTDPDATTTAQEDPPQTATDATGEAEGTSEGSETSNPDDGDLAPQEAFKPNPNETEELQNVRFLMHRAGVKESQVMAFARKNSMAKPEQKLSDLSGAKLKTIASSWPNKVAEIKAIKE